MAEKKDSGFKKGNKHGFTPIRDRPLDSRNLQLKLEQGMLDRVKAIDGWQEDIRDLVKLYLKSKEKPPEG
jgi:hypothetical protein